MKKNIWIILLSFIICNDLFSAVNEFIKINQIGYLPLEDKIFFVSTTPATNEFKIYELSGKEIFKSTLTYVGFDSSSGDDVWVGIFSELSKEGTYYISIPNFGESYQFKISSGVYWEVYYRAMRGFLLQRCGCSLNEPELKHSACHTKDGELFLSGKNLKVNAVGGWHDAGDYGKYIVNLGVSVGTLLHIYELCKEKFTDRQLNLSNGESYDFMPDILNEIKYGISWTFAMQNLDNGGVYHKLTAKNFEPLSILPDGDYEDRFIIDLSRGTTQSTETTAATGNFIGMMAAAYRVFKDYDYNFAVKCLSAAIKGWEFLEKNPTIIPQGGFRNPENVSTGEYGDWNDTDERLWAAAELFASTKQQKFSDYFISKYSSINSPMSWQNLKNLAVYTYYFTEGADESVKSLIEQDVRNYADLLVSRIESNPYKVVLRSTEYYWGSNSVVLNYAIDLIYAYEITKNEKYKKAALEQLHYILGRNATNFCYVTGLGSKSPQSIHHRPSVAISKALPGFLVAGPNSRGNDPTLSEYINSFNPPVAKCYIDNYEAYSCNEVAINWNAPLVFVSAYFLNSQFNFQIMPPIYIEVKSPTPQKELKGKIPIEFVIYSSTNIKKVEIFVNEAIESVISEESSVYYLDTEKYPDGSAVLKIVVYDMLNNSAQKEVPVRFVNKLYSKFSKTMIVTLNKDNTNKYVDFTNNSTISVKKVSIYNSKGKLVKEIKNSPFVWNGESVEAGLYIYYITTKQNDVIRGKLIILK